MDMFDTAVELLPYGICSEALKEKSVEELRLRIGQPVSALYGGFEHTISNMKIGETELLRTIEKATGASMHSASSSLRRGYISYKGLRVGVCGAADCSAEGIYDFRRFSSLNIRIPSARIGIMNEAVKIITRDGMGGVLIVSPPGGGKTTALRELVRELSEKEYRICVADERNEIAAGDVLGKGFYLGRHTDVMTDIPKAKAAIMMLRSMNPQIIAFDEISECGDIETVREISSCGVYLLATVHGRNITEIRRSFQLSELISDGVFKYVITITVVGGMRSYSIEELS